MNTHTSEPKKIFIVPTLSKKARLEIVTAGSFDLIIRTP